MNILWHGIAPWHKTGYGRQTALFAPRLRDLGHHVALSVMGRRGIDDDPERCHPDARDAVANRSWDGMTILGPGLTEYALPLPLDIKTEFGGDPDLVIVMKDAWVLGPRDFRRHNTAVWCDIDCEPVGKPDLDFFTQSGARPVAVSRWAVGVMRAAGLDPLYVPHGIDRAGWYPPSDRAAVRRELGLPEHSFIVGINAANIGTLSRKAWPEQLTAFTEFRKRLYPDSLLLAHTMPQHPEGLDIRAIVKHLGIGDAVRFGAHGNMTTAQMRMWYQSLDVLLNATYGEGFGLPIVEALACGVPVIATDCSAMTEKVPTGCGWLVKGQRLWNPHHQAWWVVPNVAAVTAKLAHAVSAKRPEVPPHYADTFGADRIVTEYWKPALGELGA